MNAEITAEGNLKITLEDDEREEVEEAVKEGHTDLDILTDGLEGYWTNSSFRPFDAGDGNPFVGLTAAPCIAEDMSTDDDGKNTIDGRLWYFDNYMLKSFIQTLLEEGSVEFTEVPSPDIDPKVYIEAFPCSGGEDPSPECVIFTVDNNFRQQASRLAAMLQEHDLEDVVPHLNLDFGAAWGTDAELRRQDLVMGLPELHLTRNQEGGADFYFRSFVENNGHYCETKLQDLERFMAAVNSGTRFFFDNPDIEDDVKTHLEEKETLPSP